MNEQMAYRGFKPCGHVELLIVDEKNVERDERIDLADALYPYIVHGHIDRVDLQTARATGIGCPADCPTKAAP